MPAVGQWTDCRVPGEVNLTGGSLFQPATTRFRQHGKTDSCCDLCREPFCVTKLHAGNAGPEPRAFVNGRAFRKLTGCGLGSVLDI